MVGKPSARGRFDKTKDIKVLLLNVDILLNGKYRHVRAKWTRHFALGTHRGRTQASNELLFT